MRTPLRLALAAKLVLLSAAAAHAEKVTLACEPEGNANPTLIVDVDYDRHTATMSGNGPGFTLPARITDREIIWEHKFAAGANNYSLNRITARLTLAYSVAGNLGTSFFRCSRAKPVL